jgi:hypothetical protein
MWRDRLGNLGVHERTIKIGRNEVGRVGGPDWTNSGQSPVAGSCEQGFYKSWEGFADQLNDYDVLKNSVLLS